MSGRQPGYYWVTWTKLADEEVALRRPGPLVAQWDGAVWWLIRSDTYRFDSELDAIGQIRQLAPAEFPRPILAYTCAAQA